MTDVLSGSDAASDAMHQLRSNRSMRRTVRKIRFTPEEWARVTDRAAECARPPARYVREVALGSIPRVRHSQVRAPIIRELGRIAVTLVQIASGRPETFNRNDDPVVRDMLQRALDELLAAVRRIG